MQFSVPLFIEREARIVGPLTFKQFVYLGAAGLGVLILKALGLPALVFILLSAILGIIALLLAFLNVGGRTLPQVLVNFFGFFTSAKVFLWRRKQRAPRLVSKVALAPKKEPEEAPTLKIAEKSRLKKLFVRVETQHK